MSERRDSRSTSIEIIGHIKAVEGGYLDHGCVGHVRMSNQNRSSTIQATAKEEETGVL